MRADFIRIYKSVHTWAGIVSGLALFIAFYAGALTVFKEPIRRWSTPPAAIVQSVPLDDVQHADRADPVGNARRRAGRDPAA